MKRRCFEIFLMCSLFFGATELAFAACDQTLSPGANIASAVSSAPNGSTVCLNNGNYGVVNLFNITRTGFVTIQSTTGVGAQMSPRPGNSRFIRFQSMTLTNVTVNGCSLNIEFINTPFVEDAPGLLISQEACPTTPQNILVDGATFIKGKQILYEGRLNCRDCNTVTIKNSLFSGVSTVDTSGPSDGIQTQGASRNLTIGPGNIFEGILQPLCNQAGGAHCDSIQLYSNVGPVTVMGNMFRNGSNVCQCTDNNMVNTRFINNVVYNMPSFQIGCGGCSLNGFTIEHNTFQNSFVNMNSTTNGLFRSNILIDGASFSTGGGSSGCVNCTISHNLCDGSCSGTNQIIGTPTFIGGVPPITNFAGWQLAVGSLGKSSGHDGLDRGTNYYGPDASNPPAPPTSLTLQ